MLMLSNVYLAHLLHCLTGTTFVCSRLYVVHFVVYVRFVLADLAGRFAAARASAGEHGWPAPVSTDSALQLRHRARHQGARQVSARQRPAAQERPGGSHQRRRQGQQEVDRKQGIAAVR